MSKSTTPPQNPLATPQLPHNCACCFSNSARRSDSARCCLHSSWSRTGSNAARPFSEGLRRIDNIEIFKEGYIYISYIILHHITIYIYIYYDIICCIRYQYLTVSILHCMYMYYIYIHMWQYEFNAKNRMESDIHRRIWIYVVYWCVVICIVLMSRLHTGRDPGSFVRGNNFAMEPKYHVFFLIALHHRPSWCDKVYKAI